MANGSNYKTSATEFCKRLTTLYKLRIFPRMGSQFADKMCSAGVEAGANICALATLSDAESKLKVAREAIVKLNEVAFAAQIMVEGGYYTEEECAPLNAYIEKLIEALSNLVASIKQRQAASEVRPVRPQRRLVIEQQPVIKKKVTVRTPEEILREAQAEADKKGDKKPDGAAAAGSKADIKPSGDSGDPDGFNAPAEN